MLQTDIHELSLGPDTDSTPVCNAGSSEAIADAGATLPRPNGLLVNEEPWNRLTAELTDISPANVCSSGGSEDRCEHIVNAIKVMIDKRIRIQAGFIAFLTRKLLIQLQAMPYVIYVRRLRTIATTAGGESPQAVKTE